MESTSTPVFRYYKYKFPDLFNRGTKRRQSSNMYKSAFWVEAEPRGWHALCGGRKRITLRIVEFGHDNCSRSSVKVEDYELYEFDSKDP